MSNIIYSTQNDNLTTLSPIQPIFPVTIEDNSKEFYGSSVIAGQPLTIATATVSGGVTKGQVKVAGATDVVYGLAKATVKSNASVDEVNGTNGFGFYGSGKITVCMFGVFEITNFDYVLADGSTVAFKAFDDSVITYAGYTPGAALYANANGLITTTAGTNAVSFGRLLAVSSDGKTIQVKIGC